VIGPISRGDNAGGLVRYLLGPGRAAEHHNQRVIAAEAGITAPRGAALSEEEIQTLAFEMDLPHRVHGTRITRKVQTAEGTMRQPAHVWHVSLSNPAGDRVLRDAEWADIAEDLMNRLGFSAGPGRAPCPWVAIHHGASAEGNDHIHIAVSLVREDGTKGSVHNDRINVGRACSHYERTYGLTIVEGRAGGARHGRTAAEAQLEKRRRVQGPGTQPVRPAKAILESAVRAAAVASSDEGEFVRRLRDANLAVRPRFAAGASQTVIGYSVGVRGDNVVWYGGGRLSADLTLPKLRALWGSDAETQQAAVAEWKREGASPAGKERQRYATTQWREAAGHVSRVLDKLVAIPGTDDATWRAMASEASGVVANLAARLEPQQTRALTRAADQLSAAAHRPSHVRAERGKAGAEFRGVAAVAAQAMLPGGPAAWLALVAEMRRVAKAIEIAHRASEQAGAARALAAQAARELEAVHTRYATIAAHGGLAASHSHGTPAATTAPADPGRIGNRPSPPGSSGRPSCLSAAAPQHSPGPVAAPQGGP